MDAGDLYYPGYWVEAYYHKGVSDLHVRGVLRGQGDRIVITGLEDNCDEPLDGLLIFKSEIIRELRPEEIVELKLRGIGI